MFPISGKCTIKYPRDNKKNTESKVEEVEERNFGSRDFRSVSPVRPDEIPHPGLFQDKINGSRERAMKTVFINHH